MKLSKRTKKVIIAAVSVIVLAFLCSLTAFADGEVAGAVESTWNAAKGQSPLRSLRQSLNRRKPTKAVQKSNRRKTN